ncbi:hypothetical protein C8F04DRAFT_1078088 [Mycena alexandri]|uniref:Uncharacterized protein n=1 Tax=Mycena alexandri TaxID=1745969 RepID=A0AAD6X9W3_9AGAR|nr:hypothetical protein C8F04DRAFT_1078088 [Mycena alexandri]
MLACPPTPVVRRHTQRLASHPYMRFHTDFRASVPENDSSQGSSQVPITNSTYPPFRRASSIETPEDSIDASDRARSARSDLSFSLQRAPATDALAKSHSFPPITSQPLECIDESEVEENFLFPSCMRSPDDAHASSPIFSVSSSSRPLARLASPSTRPRRGKNDRMVRLDSIEEYELEDDDADVDADGRPPISSSPGRSSDDPFFPFNDSLSSPRTSDHGHDSPKAHAHDSGAAPADPEFSSKLVALLAVAAQHRERHEEIDNDLAATLGDRSLSVTPDYRASPTPQNGSKGAFGPRVARRTVSWSTCSSDSVGVQSCPCSDCRSESATRTGSVGSVSSYSGYAADLDDPAPASATVPAFSLTQTSLTNFRASNSATPTQHLTGNNASNSISASPHSVKRTYSSLREDVALSNSYKKSKPNSRSSSGSRSHPDASSTSNPSLSRVPASLRKSLSLRSDASKRSPSSLSDELVPTQLNTPCPLKTGRVIRDYSPCAIPFDVPIIAPPPQHMARLPLSAAACAKIRLGNLLDREARGRAADRLDGVSVASLLSTLQVDGENEKEERALERLRWEHVLGVGPELRREVVDWILDVLPKKSCYLPRLSTASKRLSRSASGPTSSPFSLSRDFGFKGLPDLIDQLLYSPETRFHAAYMFVRYFYLLMGHDETRARVESMQASALAAENEMPFDPTIPAEGWSLVVWDCCVACLAISVKMHRDVLEPLQPVLSWEFEALAPHNMSFDELETAQRDILETFAFSLGGTPQPILDELWIALPSLQHLLHFENGWGFTQKETWWRLNDAVLEPDILQLPISVLTIAALTEALVSALVSKYEYDASHTQVVRRRPNRYSMDSKKREKYVIEAEQEMEGVVQDIQAVIGISDERLRTCRRWLRAALKD